MAHINASNSQYELAGERPEGFWAQIWPFSAAFGKVSSHIENCCINA